jgi:hypothetical protein
MKGNRWVNLSYSVKLRGKRSDAIRRHRRAVQKTCCKAPRVLRVTLVVVRKSKDNFARISHHFNSLRRDL